MNFLRHITITIDDDREASISDYNGVWFLLSTLQQFQQTNDTKFSIDLTLGNSTFDRCYSAKMDSVSLNAWAQTHRVSLPESELDTHLYAALFGLSEEQLIHMSASPTAMPDTSETSAPDADSSDQDLPSYVFAIEPVRGSQDEIIFSWKRLLDTAAIKQRVGEVHMRQVRVDSPAAFAADLLQRAADALGRFSRAHSSLLGQCRTLRSQCRQLETNLDHVVTEKTSAESSLYQAFLRVLNSKKRRIQELSEELEASPPIADVAEGGASQAAQDADADEADAATASGKSRASTKGGARSRKAGAGAARSRQTAASKKDSKCSGSDSKCSSASASLPHSLLSSSGSGCSTSNSLLSSGSSNIAALSATAGTTRTSGRTRARADAPRGNPGGVPNASASRARSPSPATVPKRSARPRKCLASGDEEEFNFEEVELIPPAMSSLPLSGDPVASFLARGGRSPPGGSDSPARGSCAAARAAASASSGSASASAVAPQFEPTIGSAQTSSSSSGSQRALPASQSPSPPRDLTPSARPGRSLTQRTPGATVRNDAPLGDSSDAPIVLPDTVPYMESESLEELVPAATSSQHASLASASPSAFVSTSGSSARSAEHAVVPSSPPKAASAGRGAHALSRSTRPSLSPPVAVPSAARAVQVQQSGAVTASNPRRARAAAAASGAPPPVRGATGGVGQLGGGEDSDSSTWLSTIRPQVAAQSSTAPSIGAGAASAAIATASASSSASRSVAVTAHTTHVAGAAAASASASQISESSATSERRTSTRLAQKRERRGDTGVAKGRYGKRSGHGDFVDSGSDSE